MITNSNNKVQQPTNNPFIDTPIRKPKGKAICSSLPNIALVSSKDKSKIVNQRLLSIEALILTIKENTKEKDIQRVIYKSLQDSLQKKTSRESSLVNISIGPSSSTNP